MTDARPQAFHLHLVSDATGETLTALSKAATVHYPGHRLVEHIHPLVRTKRQLSHVLGSIQINPGIVLYTLVNTPLAEELETFCRSCNMPCVAVLSVIFGVFESYLGKPSTPTVGGQHALNADYFRRIDALNFTMAHDDGNLPDDIGEADIVIIGISRTSKTPTSIYLANRGYKTANVPLVSGIPLSQKLMAAGSTLVVGLVASSDRIAQVRRHRLIELGDVDLRDYVDRDMITAEIAYTRRLCAAHEWPVIDVTRRSIEETAAAIVKLFQDRNAEMIDL